MKYFLTSILILIGTKSIGSSFSDPKHWTQQGHAALKIIDAFARGLKVAAKIIEDGKIVDTRREGPSITYWIIYKANMFYCRSYSKIENEKPTVLVACTSPRVRGFR